MITFAELVLDLCRSTFLRRQHNYVMMQKLAHENYTYFVHKKNYVMLMGIFKLLTIIKYEGWLCIRMQIT